MALERRMARPQTARGARPDTAAATAFACLAATPDRLVARKAADDVTAQRHIEALKGRDGEGAEMTLRQRLNRLELKRDGSDAGPELVFLCDAVDEARAALPMGGGGIVREDGEPAEAFTPRASAGISRAVYRPDNQRNAMATGRAPEWAQGELVTRHLGVPTD